MIIEKSTLSFLADLKSNNNRDWFLDNKSRYEKAKENFTDFVQDLIDGLSKYDRGLKGIEARKCVFRINRDIRFSANKSPYKSNMGASFSAAGKNSHEAGYYIHLEAIQVFLQAVNGCPKRGNYQQSAKKLITIRRSLKKYWLQKILFHFMANFHQKIN